MLPSLRVLLMAARPKTLWAGAAPVLLGASLALSDGVFHAPSALCAMLGALFIQIGTNYYNDAADHEMGADGVDRKGPVRAAAAGLATSAQMKRAAVAAFTLAVASGAYLILRGGWPIALVGFSAILFGVLYTAGRRSLAYLGIADIFVLIYFGPVAVAGTYYVQALELYPQILFAGMAPGLWSVAILMVNNIRDEEEDRRAGKRTLAVRIGRSNAVGLYAAATGTAVLVPPLLAFWTFGHLFALVSIIVIVPLFRQFSALADPAREDELNDVLARTAQLLLVHTLLFAAGWLVPS